MGRKLLIVESPAKAKTIEKILGKDFTVKSSYGHIRDLDKGNKAVDIANGFAAKYIVAPEKARVVKELREQMDRSEEVWLATDEDREGEAISWHLCEVLGLDVLTTPRIVFREITKPAIQKAVSQPRRVDVNLVNAQQARRILDRLVGYELSEILWRKIKGKLSAGRVQSVAVKLIVDREREIQQFKEEAFFRVSALFIVKLEDGRSAQVKAVLSKEYRAESDAMDFLQRCIGADFSVSRVEVKPARRKPAAPFTTSTLQQEASRKLGFAVKRTMNAAQRLYEEGHISYMRTDSTSLSEEALSAIAAEIEQQFGKQYIETRRYKTKNESAQEAHEAIRPTYIQNHSVAADPDQQRLYDLIWRRTIASQMADAQLEKTHVDIAVSSIRDAVFQATGEVLIFDGFLKVYLESKDEEEDEENQKLPPMRVSMPLDLDSMTATERFSRPPSRYSEASLVKKLEELGIGRPSTYVPTISKIMEDERGYVTKESRDGVERMYRVLQLEGGKIQTRDAKEISGATKNRLYPSDIGMLVTDFLDQHFDDIMNYGFTAEIEKQFDKIADGDMDWRNMLEQFYGPFHSDVAKTLEEAGRATGERLLGTDPETGHSVVARISRFGKPIIMIGKTDEIAEGEKPRFANLKIGQSLETITYEDAMELFKLPQTLGEYEGQEVVVNTGRFGPYIKFGETYVNLPARQDPMEITLERAIELIREKQAADAPIGYFKELPVTKGKGRFGPFVKWSNLFVNIPRAYNFDTITISQAAQLIEAKLDKEANRYIQHWEKEKIAIENGRWGPFIRFGKHMLKLPKLPDGAKMTPEHCMNLSLEEVKKMIEAEMPGAFEVKAKAPAKKAGEKKPAAKKAPAKKK